MGKGSDRDEQRRSHNPFLYIYKNISLLGMYSSHYFVKIMRAIFRRIGRPIKYIFAWLRVFVIFIDRFGFKSVRAFSEEWRYLKTEVRSARKYIRQASKNKSVSVFSVINHYIFKGLRRHRGLFKSVVNTALPVIAIIALLITTNYWNGLTYALEVIYKDKPIGYISNESVYLESRNLAADKLAIGFGKDNTENILGTPQYSLVLVSVNELDDVSTLCDNMLNASDANITNACGIYIDGEFLCSVKNENDARSVFNSILSKQEVVGNEKVGFVEEIKYVQGLYPDNPNTMWDAGKLERVLASSKKGEESYIAQYGDSFSSIAAANGLTVSELKAMNPSLSNGIMVGDRVVISQQVNYVRVKVVKTEQSFSDVKYNTIVTYNPNLFQGDTRVIRKGENGKDIVTTQITYINGVVYSKNVIARTRVTEPTDEKVEKGTKSTSVRSSAYGSYNLSVSNSGFVWPAPTARAISQYFGHNGHKGIDITTSGASGRVIVAAAAGVVEVAGSTGNSYGQQVVINHGNGIVTRYAHCLYGSISVRPGQRVSAGQAIARIGSTGNSTGPHLHFEVIRNGYLVNPLNYVSR
ncbi:MAG: M23 family metallopeptidase [Clostridiales bacterium]|nr:M23 family metallopeptidase [Clostridiales bacterium]